MGVVVSCVRQACELWKKRKENDAGTSDLLLASASDGQRHERVTEKLKRLIKNTQVQIDKRQLETNQLKRDYLQYHRQGQTFRSQMTKRSLERVRRQTECLLGNLHAAEDQLMLLSSEPHTREAVSALKEATQFMNDTMDKYSPEDVEHIMANVEQNQADLDKINHLLANGLESKYDDNDLKSELVDLGIVEDTEVKTPDPIGVTVDEPIHGGKPIVSTASVKTIEPKASSSSRVAVSKTANPIRNSNPLSNLVT